MSVKDKYHVEKIPSELAYPFILKSHYAHRIPPITYAYGLYLDKTLKGICTFGRPVAHRLIDKTFQGHYVHQFIELNRLCVVEGLEKNTLSWFVSKVLKILPSPMIIVSYADREYHHAGYIYQALNFYYTGLSAFRRDPFIKGMENKHYTSVYDSLGRGVKDRTKLMKKIYGDRFYYKTRSRKHRYFYFIGSKKEIKEMKAFCIYPFLPYPKDEPQRYKTEKVHVLQRLI